ncbi:thioredoxin domain-containing protein [Pararhodospirillum photometricum]|nr:thioredoxin domain-containing protein [Pararhodospirillum photometricum]
MSRNRLGEETSPYLRQHRTHPVHWAPWGPEAFAEARATHRPILLSVGYAACHWCHVMAHESFEDPAVADIVNALFVPVKVDREERPDIDAFYQAALAATGQPGGWPLTVFLTPEGKPFAGGTYFPPEPRQGRPGFVEVLKMVSNFARSHPEDMDRQADALTEALRPHPPEGAREGGRLEDLDAAVRALLAHIDPEHGGLGGAPKFPMPAVFALMHRVAHRTDDPGLGHAVTHSLTRMAQGGLYDHLAGGFARYATDAAWQIPHFEKMLYDNALLIELMTEVWRSTRDPLLARRVRQTVAWLDREMSAENGAFAASLDADNEAGEGGFALWSVGEIKALLGPLAPAFMEAYGVTPEGTWEGHNILHRAGPLLDADAETALEEHLASARDLLWRAREHRPRPARDDKVLADWNGLVIAALARAGLVFGEPAWIARARHAWEGILATMTRPDHRLGHSLCHGRLQAEAMLEDYAGLMRAGLALYEITGEAPFLEQVLAWANTVEGDYRDDDSPGYCQTARSAQDLPWRPRSFTDTATPSGTGLLLQAYARLFHLTGDLVWRERIDTVVRPAGEALLRQFPYTASVLQAVDFLETGLLVTLEGTDPAWEAALSQARHGAFTVRRLPNTIKSPRATVCRDGVCGPPLTTPESLRQALDHFLSR